MSEAKRPAPGRSGTRNAPEVLSTCAGCGRQFKRIAQHKRFCPGKTNVGKDKAVGVSVSSVSSHPPLEHLLPPAPASSSLPLTSPVDLKHGLDTSELDWDVVNAAVGRLLLDKFGQPADWLTDVSSFDSAADTFLCVLYDFLAGHIQNMVSEKSQHPHRFRPEMSVDQARAELKRLRSRFRASRGLVGGGDGHERDELFMMLDLISELREREAEESAGRFSFAESVRFDRNPFEYVKRMRHSRQVEPTLTQQDCQQFFTSTYSDEARESRCFSTPSWLPVLPPIQHAFNDKDWELSDIEFVLKAKRSGSAVGPVDGIGYDVYKHCPSAWPYLLRLFNVAKQSCHVPGRMPKLGVVRLLYKDGPNDRFSNPGSFRPICLSSCLWKIFSSLLLRDLMSFALDNHIIDSSVQKGFLDCPGCWEHAFSVSLACETARFHRKSLVGVFGGHCQCVWLSKTFFHSLCS